MIADGYTAVLTLADGVTVLHRPLPEAERRILTEWARRLDDKSGLELLRSVARKRVVHPEGFFGLLTLADCVRVLQSPTEKADLANLRSGLAIVKRYPHMAELTCGQCRKWWYDPLRGRINRREGRPIPRTEEPCLCELSKECPFGHFSKPRGFNARNRMAFAHWRGCRLTGRFPDDPIVQRNARVIEEALYGNPLELGGRTGARRSGDAGVGTRGGDRTADGRRGQRFVPV